jgi:hypothetical protein
MFVGDVYAPAVARSPVMLSDGRPVVSSVIASSDAQVSSAYRCRVSLPGLP